MQLAFLLKVVSGLGVLLASFWVTLMILDDWFDSSDIDSPARLIEVTDATYGMNCRGFVVAPGQVNRVSSGNVTEAIRKLCKNAHAQCQFFVDAAELGDPAPGCAKDMTIKWLCGTNQKPYQVMIAPEAHTKKVNITCPNR